MKINLNNDTSKKILSFRQLEPGWNYGAGVRPSDEVISFALFLNSFLLDITELTNAFPGENGEIQITAYKGPVFLEITIESQLSCDFIFEYVDDVITYKENLSLKQTLQSIVDFKGLIWALSESSIKSTTIHIKNDLQALPLNHQAMEGYPSLTRNVVYRPVQQSAGTFKDIMKTYLATPPYSGNYLARSSQRPANLYKKEVNPAMNVTIISSV